MFDYIEKYKNRFGCYPRDVLADKIYCTRINRAVIKGLGIKLIAKPFGIPLAMSNHVRPGEWNPVEGKFDQAKTGCGLNRIKARLKGTSESWIATIILVLNLVKLVGVALLCLTINFCESFSARLLKMHYIKAFRLLIQIDDSRQILQLKVGWVYKQTLAIVITNRMLTTKMVRHVYWLNAYRLNAHELNK